MTVKKSMRPDGAHLGLSWRVISNLLEQDRCLLEFVLSNRGSSPLEGRDWAIYFNGVNRPEAESSGSGARVEAVNGDVYRIVPTEDFGRLLPGESRQIRYVGSAWAVQRTDCPRGAYIVYGDGTPSATASEIGDALLEPFVRPEQLVRGARDGLPWHSPAVAYQDNQRLSALPFEQVGRITPTPCSLSLASSTFQIDHRSSISHAPELASEAHFLRAALCGLMGFALPLSLGKSSRSIELRLDRALAADDGAKAREAYTLDVTTDGIRLTAAAPVGIFRAIQSLRQLTPSAAWLNPSTTLEIPCCTVQDAPRFSYRGMHLDVARNFSSKAAVLRLLETMALYKLNKFHFHLTDDEGWRLSIPALPELTDYGARRGFSPGERECLPPSFGSGPGLDGAGSGFYTRQELVEILQFARERHIQVIPEIDVPGHARAAIKSMEVRYERLRARGLQAEAEAYLLTDLDDHSRYRSEQGWRDNVICIGRESCYSFIELVVSELKSVFDEAGAPLEVIHLGGDEMPSHCWENSPQCRSFMKQHGLAELQELGDYFYARVRAILDGHGVRLAGWEEIALLRPLENDTSVSPNPQFVDAQFLPYVWNTAITSSQAGLAREDAAFRLANAGYQVVLCSVANLYLDFAYEKNPGEPGYYWGGYIDAKKVFDFCPQNPFLGVSVNLFGEPLPPGLVARMEPLAPEAYERLLGIQGQLWGENIRSASDLEYLLLPRLLPLAERAWARDPGWDQLPDSPERQARMASDWNEFANRLGRRELPRLDGFLGGMGYRVPVPGALLRDGVLCANVDLPGFVLRYTTDGSEPTMASPVYAPIRTEQATVAAFTTSGRRGRSVTVRAEPRSDAMVSAKGSRREGP